MKLFIVIILVHTCFAEFPSSADIQSIEANDISPLQTIRTDPITNEPIENADPSHGGVSMVVPPELYPIDTISAYPSDPVHTSSSIAGVSPTVSSQYCSTFPTGDHQMDSPSVFSGSQPVTMLDSSDLDSNLQNTIVSVPDTTNIEPEAQDGASLATGEPSSYFTSPGDATPSNQIIMPDSSTVDDEVNDETTSEKTVSAVDEPDSVFSIAPISPELQNNATPDSTTVQNGEKSVSNTKTLRRDSSLRYKITPIFIDTAFLPVFMDPKDAIGPFMRSVFRRFGR